MILKFVPPSNPEPGPHNVILKRNTGNSKLTSHRLVSIGQLYINRCHGRMGPYKITEHAPLPFTKIGNIEDLYENR